MKKLLVFTDLDGTLLDHDNYTWKPALTAVQALKEHSFPLIINSSKTSSEIKKLKKQLGNLDPFICENGAVVHINSQLQAINESHLKVIIFSKPYNNILTTLNTIRQQHNFDFLGFNDIEVNKLMELTGLDEDSAIAAKQRETSEPLLWKDSNEQFQRFTTILQEHKLDLIKGGRFHHVISAVSKGETMKWLIKQYQKMEPDTHWITVGLGDSFNDIPMLEQVDYPVLITNPFSNKPDISHIKKIIESTLPGPEGWNTEVLNIIKNFKEQDNG